MLSFMRKFYWQLLVLMLVLLNSFFAFKKPAAAADGDRPVYPEKIFVKPVEGLETGIFGSISPEQVLRSIIGENFQVYCSNELSTVMTSVSETYNRYFELYGDGEPVELNPTANAGIDEGLKMRSGLVRDDQGETIDIDYETHFGNYEVTDAVKANPYENNTVMAGYYKLLPDKTQCKLSQLASANTKSWCGLLDKPGACPANIQIPNTDFTVLDFAGEVGGIDCDRYDETEYTRTVDPKIRIGIANMPYYQVNTYKPVFLAAVTEQKPVKELGNLFKFWDAGWWSRNIKEGDRIEVKVVILPVSNMEENPGSDPVDFDQKARQVLTRADEWAAEQLRLLQERNSRLNAALEALERGFSEGDRVNCVNCDHGTTSSVYTALASYINSENPVCDYIITEDSPDIDSYASIPSNLGYGYKIGDGSSSPYASYYNDVYNYIGSDFDTKMMIGNVPQETVEALASDFETFIIAPYDDRDSVFHLLSTLTEQEHYEVRMTQLPEQIKFNRADDQVGTEGDSHSFYDPAKCRTNDQGEEVGCRNSFTVSLSGIDKKDLSNPDAPDIRDDINELPRRLTSQYHPGFGSLAATEDNSHDFLIGVRDGLKNIDGGGDSEEIVPESCEEYESETVEIPKTNSQLEKWVCDVADGNSQDAQLLYGLLRIEGREIFDLIAAGTNTIGCDELIDDVYGVSQIMGVVVPACTTLSYLKGNDKPPVSAACDVKGALQYSLETRKKEKETTYLKNKYAEYNNGRQPSMQEFYYLMAARHLGIPIDNEADIFTSPVCEGTSLSSWPGTDVSGCGGANYCQCAMDTFKFSCN